MARKGIYYFGRVLKLGNLDQEKLISAINNPVEIETKGYCWTFIDVEEYNEGGIHYIYGRLAKYQRVGEVSIVDTANRSERKQVEPNLRKASSTFVYIPEFSGIAFLNVSGQIEYGVFAKRFCSIIENTYDGFFVNCEIEFISDLRSFSSKINALDGIYEIKAAVSPPNPLFGPLWENLKNYLQERNADRLRVDEIAPEDSPLNTNLGKHIEQTAKQKKDQHYKPAESIPLTESAILMAADGYGHGSVTGKTAGETVVVKTSETVKNIKYYVEPDSGDLYVKAEKVFSDINKSRHLTH